MNGLFARNQASNGAAVYVAAGAALDLVHTTIVSPTQASGSAVYVADGTLNLTNTIVAAHATGIDNPFSGVVTAWNPLFFGNTTDTNGTVTVNNPMLGDPAFVNPAADDYHLTAASAAINAGVTPVPDVTTDFEGDPRPQQGGYDIGYDESPFNTPPVITPSAGAGGSITPATPQRIAYGADITFTITPDTGYTILDVVVDSVSQGPVTEYAFVNVQANRTIAASFATTTPITPGTLEFVNLPGVITAVATPVPIQGQVAPPNSLTELTVAVDATPILTETYEPATVLSEIFQALWTPVLDGVYRLTAQATDELSGTVEISATLFVDTTPPQAMMNGDTFTSTAYSPGGGLRFSGVASDTTGIVSATAYLDFGSGPTPVAVAFDQTAVPVGYLNGQAVYSQTTWRATWWETENLPNNVFGLLYLVLYDVTQAPVTHTFPVILDPVPPDVAVTLRANGAPITTSHTYRESLLETTAYITATDGAMVDLWYGWTETYTPTLAELTRIISPSVALTLTQAFPRSVDQGGTARFFHIRAFDAYGNARAQVFGPYYHDRPGMPDYISLPGMGDGFTAGVYRDWQLNGCTLQGVDQRLTARGVGRAALSSAQSFYLTWNEDRLHLVWQGADWATDGDLFIYLDTIPDLYEPAYQQVGGGAAYNPYTSTYSSTVLLLPTEDWSQTPYNVAPGQPKVNAMHADYALWVTDSTTAHLLRWDNLSSQWVISGSLNELGGAYALNEDMGGIFTDLIVPFALVGNPQNHVTTAFWRGMGVVALAVDAEEGAGSGLPGAGLRIWSILPYANPADSARVVSNAPGADQPHLMTLTDRYVVPVANDACFAPEAGLVFYLVATTDRFAYNGFADNIRLLLPVTAWKWSFFERSDWAGLFEPYDDGFQAWLAADYCPTHPTVPACRPDKSPAELSNAELLAGLIDSQHPPLLPGSTVTYTMYYFNPAETAISKRSVLFASGVDFPGLSWYNGCFPQLMLTLQPGVGQWVFTGTVQAAGADMIHLVVDPPYDFGPDCQMSTVNMPKYSMIVRHTLDDGAPTFVDIAPEFTVAGPISAVIPGVVQDASPVITIEIEVTSLAGVSSFLCSDATPTDGQWACPWDIPTSNGGLTPTNGVTFSLRARATDAFGNQSAWSEPQEVQIDTLSPQFEAGGGRRRLAAQAPLTPTLLRDQVIYLSGVISDNTAPQSIEVCDTAGQNCAAASLTLDPWTVPPTAYSYADVLTTPVAINDDAVCGSGALGLARTFEITDSFAIGALQVGLRLSHPYRSDISATLQSPTGAQVTLFSFTKNILAENINALFTDRSLAQLPADRSHHDLDADFVMHTYRPQDSLSAFDGEDAAGTWTLTLCDSDSANDAGAFYAAALNFAAATPPLNVTGKWIYGFDASGSDGALYAWQLFATDIHGNRTAQPYSLTVQVDNVAPVITATQTVTQMLRPGSVPLLSGVVSDGDAVSTIWLGIVDPLGNAWTEAVQGDATAWTYTFTPTMGGRHYFTVYAADRAGNQARVEMFPVDVLQPLEIRQTVTPEYEVAAGAMVTYTLWVYNYTMDETAEEIVISSTLHPWLTPVDTAGASYANDVLTWPPMTLAAGSNLSLTVQAQLPDVLLIATPRLITETYTFTDTPPITMTTLVTDWVDLRGAFFTSIASLSTANLGASTAYPTSFQAEGAPKPTYTTLMDISKEVTPTLDVAGGSLVAYTLHITNSTDITAENVLVSDALHPALTPEAFGSATYDPVSRTLTWPAQTLVPGASITYTFNARLTSEQAVLDTLTGPIENYGLLSSTLGSGISNVAAFWKVAITPTASFTATPLTGAAPLQVTFTDLSTHTPTAWLWDFGDGMTSTLQHPVYTYLTSGVYTVILTATNAAGSDSITRPNYIVVGEGPIPIHFIYLPLTLRNFSSP